MSSSVDANVVTVMLILLYAPAVCQQYYRRAEERLFSILTMANTGYCRIRNEGGLTSVQRWFWSHVTFFQPAAVKHGGGKKKKKSLLIDLF